MLSKLPSWLSKATPSVTQRSFSIIQQTLNRVHRITNTINKSTTAYRTSKYDPSVPLEVFVTHSKGHEPLLAHSRDQEMKSTYLSNGFTVITQNSRIPSNVHMGVLIDVGTRDETQQTSGASLALQNVYLKTLRNTNETMNYGMMQMCGGDMNMTYDRQKMFWFSRCIEYDVEDIFNATLDCALEPRSVFAGNIARSKNKKSHNLIDTLEKKSDPFIKNHDLLFTTAYGYNTLGMPLHGLESNLENVDAKLLQQFVMNHVIPEKVVIAANGVNNHEEFVEMVLNRIDQYQRSIPLVNQPRQKAVYIGGESRMWRESPLTNIMIGFESASWENQQEFPYYLVLHHLIGDAAGFSAGGPGKGMHNRSNKMLSKYSFLQTASAFNFTFSDSGLFGIQVTGASSNSADLLNLAVNELKRLSYDVTDEEFARVVNQLRMTVALGVSNQSDRLEEAARAVQVFGKPDFNHQYHLLEGLSKSKLQEVARKAISGKPTIVISGSSINLVPNFTEVQRQLQ